MTDEETERLDWYGDFPFYFTNEINEYNYSWTYTMSMSSPLISFILLISLYLIKTFDTNEETGRVNNLK